MASIRTSEVMQAENCEVRLVQWHSKVANIAHVCIHYTDRNRVTQLSDEENNGLY
jgi:hypothetical protein